MHLAFENYLSLVAQLYYKATHQITEVYSIVEPSHLTASGEEKPLIQLKRGRKPGRKPKKKVPVLTDKDTEVTAETNDSIQAGEMEEEEEKQLEDPETKIPTEISGGMLVGHIDTLVSPLKVDYVFGKFIKFFGSSSFNEMGFLKIEEFQIFHRKKLSRKYFLKNAK